MVHHEEVDAAVAKGFVGLAGIEAVAAKEIKVAAAKLVECSAGTEERVGIKAVGIKAGCCICTTLGFLRRGLSSVSLSRHRRT